MIPMTRPIATTSNWERAQLYTDAPTFFQRLLECIRAAQSTVDFEYYIFHLDVLGEQFVEELAAAARRGVRVRVLVDGVGSANSSAEIARQLFDQGVAVQIYRPLPWLTGSYRWSLTHGGWANKFIEFLLNINRRNHRKLCLVDGRLAWVGSFNISADHLPRAQGGRGWRDYAIELGGAGVRSLADGFDRLWNARGPRFQPGFFARYLSNRSYRSRRMKNRFVARSVGSASHRVWVVSAYFAPTATLRRALLRACRNGRDVCLLLPERSDVAIFPGLSSHYYRELLKAGARIFLYGEGILHAKAVLIDDLAILGSSNWNYRSSLHDLELDVIVKEGAPVQELEKVIQGDFADAQELLLEDTGAPSVASWLWYALRYWM